MKLRLAGTVNHAKDVIERQLNVEHRTSNIERSILMTLRFIDFRTSEAQNLPEAVKIRRVASFCSVFFKLTEYIIRSAGGGQVLARLWRVGRSMFDVRCSFFSQPVI
jgi:hypothetical protein